jgi:peptidoglycan/xylan/chitin deacetylase (PgdA/CDA1 family)
MEWATLPTTDKVVALTFDAGANADAVASILATLKAKDVPGTFFLTGKWATQFPAQTKEIASRGYLVGNHSVSHPEFTKLSDAQIREEVTKADAQISALTGRTTTPLFRFPFGDTNTHTNDAVRALGYTSVRWTVDTLGWKGTSGGMTAAKVTERVLAKLTPGEIVLMHVGSHPTDRSTLDADALPGLIDAIRAQGYGFVSLESLTR